MTEDRNVGVAVMANLAAIEARSGGDYAPPTSPVPPPSPVSDETAGLHGDEHGGTVELGQQFSNAIQDLTSKFIRYDTGRRHAFLEGIDFATKGIHRAACHLEGADMPGGAMAFRNLAATIGAAGIHLGSIKSKAKLVRQAKRRRRRP